MPERSAKLSVVYAINIKSQQYYSHLGMLVSISMTGIVLLTLRVRKSMWLLASEGSFADNATMLFAPTRDVLMDLLTLMNSLSG